MHCDFRERLFDFVTVLVHQLGDSQQRPLQLTNADDTGFRNTVSDCKFSPLSVITEFLTVIYRATIFSPKHCLQHLLVCKCRLHTCFRLARRAVLRAYRDDDHEDISEDDSVLDVLQELIDADQM